MCMKTILKQGVDELGNDHLTKNILIPNVAEKNILILVEEKKII